MKFGSLPEKYRPQLEEFFACYRKAAPGQEAILEEFLHLLTLQQTQPFSFEPYHRKVRSPIDYYAFSLNFIRPLIDQERSSLSGKLELAMIRQHLQNQENVILLANHQTEADPQAIAILLEKDYPDLAEKIIYVAGERVVTDPLAIPFSMGCDLLCIYSKRYIDHPLELKAQKLLHNKHTMQLMSRLLSEGGKIIYVAPSGGRDRKDKKGTIAIAPFDPASIEMFCLMAKKAEKKTHFYPLALFTYPLLPPPETIQKELGERRIAKRCPVHLSFCPEFDMDKFLDSEQNDKLARRRLRADAIWHVVNTAYQRFQ